MILVTYTEQLGDQAPQIKQWITNTTDLQQLEQELVARAQTRLLVPPLVVITNIQTTPIPQEKITLANTTKPVI